MVKLALVVGALGFVSVLCLLFLVVWRRDRKTAREDRWQDDAVRRHGLALALLLLAGGAEAAPVGPLSTYLVEPCRLLDTRKQEPGFDQGPFIGLRGRPIRVQESCDVPLGAGAAILNVTVVGATAAGHVALVPSDYDGVWPPITSSINYGPGQTIANGVTVILAPSPGPGISDVWIAPNTTGGQIHLLIDVIGFLR